MLKKGLATRMVDNCNHLSLLSVFLASITLKNFHPSGIKNTKNTSYNHYQTHSKQDRR